MSVRIHWEHLSDRIVVECSYCARELGSNADCPNCRLALRRLPLEPQPAIEPRSAA